MQEVSENAVRVNGKHGAFDGGWFLTVEVALDPQVSNTEAKDRQLVQAGAGLLGERQQVGQPVQLAVQPIPVALRRVRLSTFIALIELLSLELMRRKLELAKHAAT